MEKQPVRIREVRDELIGGMFILVQFRITSPKGRKPFGDSPTKFLTRRDAESFAKKRGWTVLGGTIY